MLPTNFTPPNIEKYISEITESTFDISSFRNSNGVINYNFNKEIFHLDGEITLVELLVMSLKLYGCVSSTLPTLNQAEEVIKTHPEILLYTYLNFNTMLNKAKFDAEIVGFWNPKYDKIKYDKSKGGRMYFNDESFSFNEIAEIIALISCRLNIGAWDELNELFDMEY